MRLIFKLFVVFLLLFVVIASFFLWREGQGGEAGTNLYLNPHKPERASSKVPSSGPISEVVPRGTTHAVPSPVKSSPTAEAASAEPKLRPGLELEVPIGAKVPAALMDAGGQDDGPEIREILDSITNEFIAAMDHARQAGRNLEEAWDEARHVADEKYKLFFGQDAFNEATLEAAVEALEDGTSQPAPTAQ